MLTAQYRGDKILGIDLTEWEQGAIAFKIESSPSTGYVDIGSDDLVTGNNVPNLARPSAMPLVNWDKWGRNLGYDYIYVQDRLKELFTPPLTDYVAEEQAVLLTNLVPTVAELETVFTFEQVKLASLDYYSQAVPTRQYRFSVAAMYLNATIGETSRTTVATQLNANNHVFGYIAMDLTGIIDYIDGVGTYAGNGFQDQGFTSLVTGVTIADIAAECKSFLVSGTKVDGSPL